MQCICLNEWMKVDRVLPKKRGREKRFYHTTGYKRFLKYRKIVDSSVLSLTFFIALVMWK